MGEHLPCKQGVKSSNLSVSIVGRKAGRGLAEGISGKLWYLENCILNKIDITEM